jgi:hypothetical protein
MIASGVLLVVIRIKDNEKGKVTYVGELNVCLAFAVLPQTSSSEAGVARPQADTASALSSASCVACLQANMASTLLGEGVFGKLSLVAAADRKTPSDLRLATTTKTATGSKVGEVVLHVSLEKQ